MIIGISPRICPTCSLILKKYSYWEPVIACENRVGVVLPCNFPEGVNEWDRKSVLETLDARVWDKVQDVERRELAEKKRRIKCDD